MSSVTASLSLLTLQDMNINLAPQVDVEVWPVGVVEVAGVGPAVRHLGPLDEELGDGGGTRHHDGANSTSGTGELDTLKWREEKLIDKVTVKHDIEGLLLLYFYYSAIPLRNGIDLVIIEMFNWLLCFTQHGQHH